MFTGIVEELGIVRRTGSHLEVECRAAAVDSAPGASVAVNGVCLTVTGQRAPTDGDPGVLSFDLSGETLERSALGGVRPGDPVNLERPVTLLTRLGGHMVQGHVDGVGTVASVTPDGDGCRIEVDLPLGLERYVVEKGSITLDGVSLTVTAVDGRRFGVALIPFTVSATTLGRLVVGNPVNVEVDVVAKYVERMIGRTA